MGEWLHDTPIESILKNAREVEIKNVMTANPITVSSDTSLTKVAQILLKNEISRLPVVDDGRLVGIIAKQDVLKAMLLIDEE